jgi:hypothetical protein
MKTKFRNSELNLATNNANGTAAVGQSRLRKILLCTLMVMFAIPIFAVDAKITGWQANIKSALDAAVLVFAIVGAFLIFVQYMQGNEQAQKNLIRYVIGLAIFGLAELMVTVFI